MSETFFTYLSPRGRDESGERTECVVVDDLIWFVGWLTLQLNGFRARENIQEEKIQTLELARFICFMRFKENLLPDDSCDIIFLVKFNVKFTR